VCLQFSRLGRCSNYIPLYRSSTTSDRKQVRGADVFCPGFRGFVQRILSLCAAETRGDHAFMHIIAGVSAGMDNACHPVSLFDYCWIPLLHSFILLRTRAAAASAIPTKPLPRRFSPPKPALLTHPVVSPANSTVFSPEDPPQSSTVTELRRADGYRREQRNRTHGQLADSALPVPACSKNPRLHRNPRK